MQRTGRVALVVTILTLSGCQTGMNHSRNDSTHDRAQAVPFAGSRTPVMTLVAGDASAQADLQQHLATCLFEAEQLAKLNSDKYREPVNDLYRNIRAAKYYATLAARMNTGSTDTLTPMYQFRVNDACNTVSQLLLGELKQGSTGPEGNR